MDDDLKTRATATYEPEVRREQPLARVQAVPWMIVIALLALAGWFGWKAFFEREEGDPVASALLADWPEDKLRQAKASGSLLEAGQVAEVVMFMLTRPRGMTIRDVVMMPTNFDL